MAKGNWILHCKSCQKVFTSKRASRGEGEDKCQRCKTSLRVKSKRPAGKKKHSHTMVCDAVWDMVLKSPTYADDPDIDLLDQMGRFLDGEVDDLDSSFVEAASGEDRNSFLNRYHELQIKILNAAWNSQQQSPKREDVMMANAQK